MDGLPRPESPAPALFETPVKLVTSFLLANAPSNVSMEVPLFKLILDPSLSSTHTGYTRQSEA